MQRLLMGFAVLLIGLPMLLLAVLIFGRVEVDLTPYRATLSGWTSKVTGRLVEIDGELRVVFGTEPSLTLAGLRVADAQDTSRLFAHAERLFAKANLGVLSGGHLDLLELELAGSELNLHVDAAGQPNWRFGEETTRPAAFAPPEPRLPQHVRIDISDLSVRYRDAGTGRDWTLTLAEAHAGLAGADAPLALRAQGMWDDTPLQVLGTVRPAEGGWLDGLSVMLEGEVLAVAAKVDGTVAARGTNARRLELLAEAKTDNLRPLRDVLGVAVPAVKQASLRGRIQGDGTDLRIADIKGQLDRARLSGDLALGREGGRPRLTGGLQVSDLDVRWWTSDGAVASGAAEEPEADLGVTLGRLPPPTPIDVRLQVVGRNLTLADKLALDLALDLELDQRGLRLALSELDGGADPAKGSFTRESPGDDAPVYALRLSHGDLDLTALSRLLGVEGQLEGQMLVDIDLRSRGTSGDALQAALEGHVRLLMGAGKANVGALDRLIGGLTAAVGQALTNESKLAVVNCAAADIAFDGGRATVDLGLIDTVYSTVVVDGTADLVNHTLDLKVTPREKALSLSVAPKVLIKGRVDNPEYVIEKGSLFLSLGQLITNVAYPSTLLVGVFDEAASENPCVAMLAGGETAGATPPPEPPASQPRPMEYFPGADQL